MFVKTDYAAIEANLKQIASEAILISETMGEGIEGWATCLEAAITLTNRAFGDIEDDAPTYLYDLSIGSAILATRMHPTWCDNFKPDELEVFESIDDFKFMVGHIALRIQEALVSVNMFAHHGNNVAATEQAAHLVSDCLVIISNCAALYGKPFEISHLDNAQAIN